MIISETTKEKGGNLSIAACFIAQENSKMFWFSSRLFVPLQRKESINGLSDGINTKLSKRMDCTANGAGRDAHQHHCNGADSCQQYMETF